jgi:L-cysteine desulfidase
MALPLIQAGGSVDADMLESWESYVRLLRQEVVPALGCTDPVAIALAAAKSRGALGREPERIDVLLSRNMLKNAMAVGIPGTGASGVDLAAALGAFGGDPGAGLRVLAGIPAETVEAARRFAAAGKVRVSLADTDEVLHIEVAMSAGQDSARAVVAGDYANVTLVELNGAVLSAAGHKDAGGRKGLVPAPGALSVKAIWDFALGAPFADIAFMLDAAVMNAALSREGLTGDYGLEVGKTLMASVDEGVLSRDASRLAMIETAAAVDARMAGSALPAMTNSGSGNQGITATMPLVAFARELGASEDRLVRALVISHLVSIHIRQHWDRLSAMCGTIAAATGAACGMIYMMDGDFVAISRGIANMVGDLSGMVCDGAKPGCALKASSAVGAAVKSAILAVHGMGAGGNEGIVDDDVEKAIDNLGRLSSQGMRQADAMILDMMLSKQR